MPPPARRRRARRGETVPAKALAITGAVIGALIATAAIAAWRGGAESAPGMTSATPLAAGPSVVAGIRVDDASVDMGHVPLDTPTGHVFRLTNEGTNAVTLGEPSIKVLEGC